ncbi:MULTISPECIES: hypothetical protein [unclassified Bradyrhizobium]|uniref:hypothetical protein n=1 Tax=unclassified Bradyrhizobium TaxID=2631580 RepID=UPI0023022D18|nr:hypothetical protein [Bradyrhizobium sp. CCBAU 45321]
MSNLIEARHEFHLFCEIASMRSVWGIVAFACLGLLLSGCDTTETRYFRYGIGTELYSEDIVATTHYQDIYLTELCRQTLSLTSTREGQCVNVQLSPNDWNLLVQAGLNDVDRRCDSYLAWLDDRRRTNTAVLKELGDLTVASQAIMRVSGVSANPITLAGLAFGLAADTFINVNSRLLLEVDKTTVQTLVLRRRSEYRVELQSVRIENRPAAIHAMRSYLNICTPFTIETDINATIMVFQQAGAGALGVKPPLVGVPAQRADRPIFVTPGPKKPTPTVLSDIEKTMGMDQARNIQRVLCVDDTGDFGPEGSPTRRALIDFMGASGLQSRKPGVIENGDQLATLTKAVKDVQSCRVEALANSFETGIVSRFGEDSVRARIKRAIESVNKRVTEKIALPPELGTTSSNVAVGETIRSSITALRKAYSALGLPIAAGSAIDQQLWQQITKDGLVQ